MERRAHDVAPHLRALSPGPDPAATLQTVLIENCGATDVIDLESGHTPAVAVPVELAAILDRITEQSQRSTTRAIIDP